MEIGTTSLSLTLFAGVAKAFKDPYRVSDEWTRLQSHGPALDKLNSQFRVEEDKFRQEYCIYLCRIGLGMDTTKDMMLNKEPPYWSATEFRVIQEKYFGGTERYLNFQSMVEGIESKIVKVRSRLHDLELSARALSRGKVRNTNVFVLCVRPHCAYLICSS